MRGGDETKTEVCRLCERHVPIDLITQHHLTPKSRGGKAEHKTPMCKPCHKQLHATFSNKDLERKYPTLDALRAAEPLQPFLGWIRKQKTDRNFRTIAANGQRRRRRH